MPTEPRSIRPRQHGLTLIELIIFMVIISVGITGILSVMNLTSKNSVDPMVRKQALSVAEAVMDEVLAKDFANPSGGFTESSSTCANRNLYDDVADYNCFKTSSANRIKGTDTLGATSLAGLAAYAASIDIDSTTAALGLSGGSQVISIKVSVTGNGQNIVLTGYRSNY